MAKFTFKLQALLRHRKNLEHDRQRELAEVQKQFVALQNELKEMNDQVTQATLDVRNTKLVGTLDLNYLAAHRRFTTAMQRKAMTLVQRMALVQRDVEAAQTALAEAAKQRKIVEKLREKQFERWQVDAARKETTELDEVGMQLVFQNAQIEEADQASRAE
jgi:flagellar protein FliJ